MGKVNIIKAFTDHATHFQMEKPWVIDGLIKATNGHIAIFLPESVVPGHEFKPWEWDGVKKEINIHLAFPLEGRTFAPFDISSLEAAIAGDKEKYTAVCIHPCPACWGGDLDENDGCFICMGEKSIAYNGKDEFIPHYKCSTSFMGKLFNWNYLCTIRDALNAFGGTWEYSMLNEIGKPVLLRNGVVSIAIMEIKKHEESLLDGEEHKEISE